MSKFGDKKRYGRSFNEAQMAWGREVFGRLLRGGEVPRKLLTSKEAAAVIRAFMSSAPPATAETTATEVEQAVANDAS